MAASKESMNTSESLREAKPGWLSYLFHLEPAVLLACDAQYVDGRWIRGAKFCFLYRSRRAKYFALESAERWRVLGKDEASTLYANLPVKLVEAAAAFAAPDEGARVIVPETDDLTVYWVVRNDSWEFSLWARDRPLPAGWRAVGKEGSRSECLQFIEDECVFGAPNPGLS